MFEVKNSKLLSSIIKSSNVEKIDYLSSMSFKVTYKNGVFEIYVLDERENIHMMNINNETIKIHEYSEDNNLIKTLIVNEYGLEDIRYEDSPILTIIRKMVNGEIVI